MCVCVCVSAVPAFHTPAAGGSGVSHSEVPSDQLNFSIDQRLLKIEIGKKTKQNKSDSLATTQVVAANSLPIYGAVVRAAVEVEVERSQQSE